jgi:hypothetical protein
MSADAGGGVTGAPFSRSTVLPLIKALDSADLSVVLASLRAIARLPLEVEVWGEVTRTVLDLLDTLRSMDDGARGDVIDAAAHVPVLAIRQRLRDLARMDEARWATLIQLPQLPVWIPARLAAAYALARAGDQEAVLPLADIAAAGDDEIRVVAIHGLTMLDASAVAGQLREIVERDRYAEARLFAGIALARVGDANRLVTAVQSLDRPEVEVLWLGHEDPTEITALLEACGPLPDLAWERLKIAARKQRQSGLAQAVVTDLGRGREPGGVEARSGEARSLGAPRVGGRADSVNDHHRAAAATAQSVLAQLRGSASGSWVTDAGQAYLQQTTNQLTYLSQADSAHFVTELFALARGEEWAMVGNWMVAELIPALREPLRPDVLALFDAGADANRYQLAWTMSRAGVRTVVEALGTIIAETRDPSQVARAAWLIENAITYASHEHGPMSGSEGEPQPLAPLSELIDLGAAGPEPSGRRRRRRRRRGAYPPEPGPEAATAKPPEEEAPEEGPRWILAKVNDTTDEANPRELTQAFRAGAPHEIAVMVGRLGDWEGAMSATGRPEESVDAKLPAGQTDLTVMLVLPALGVFDARSLMLPASGPSAKVRFGFTAPSAGQRVDGSISLLHRGKIVQAALLSGSAFHDPATVPPGFEMTFRLAVIRPGIADLDTQPSFDAALITGRENEIPVTVGVRNAQSVVPFRARHVAEVVDKIRVQLKALTDDPGAYAGLDTDASRTLLLALARRGRDLYELVGLKLEEALPGRDLSRIQVVLTDPSDFIPVEFVYDFPTPSRDATLCPNWRNALSEGRCDPKHHPRAVRPRQVSVVCPLGFWGLKKVIERQVIDADDAALVDGKDFAIRAEPTAERPSLANFNSALFAWSDRVNAAVKGQSDAVLEALATVTGNQATTARTWEEWVAVISRQGPPLLVLLSHTVTDRGSIVLEIGPDGTGSRCERTEVVQEFVKRERADAPVVLLLGCDTAVARNDPQTFVARFRDAGAALVVGTIAPVLGEHAAQVASGLVRTLRALMDRQATGGNGDDRVAGADGGMGEEATTFGDAMVAVRRQLLATGELTALCVTAFGDANWQLAPQSGKRR